MTNQSYMLDIAVAVAMPLNKLTDYLVGDTS